MAPRSKKAQKAYDKHAAESAKVFSKMQNLRIATGHPGITAVSTCWGDVCLDSVKKVVWENPIGPKTEEELIKENVENTLAGWPWEMVPPELLTLGPFCFNHYNDSPERLTPFKLLAPTQQSPLFTKLLRNSVICKNLVDMLFENHSTAWKFGATCQQATQTLVDNLDFWDLVGDRNVGGYFHNCERPRYGPFASKNPALQGSAASVIVVAPMRRPDTPPTYYEQVRALNTMSIAMSNFSDYMKNLQFHRVGFLTTNLLELLVPTMRNLQVLGIYQCQLIHVGNTMKLLEIIKTDRPLERENQVSLDFFPRYHQGPPHSFAEKFTGEYGVTWDNWNGDTILAVWALMSRILKQARKQGIDFVSKHTMFRQWLDRGPCWKVEETLQALMAPKYDPVNLAALVNCHNPDHRGDVKRFTGGKDVIGNRPEGWEVYVQKYKCRACDTELIGMLFPGPDIQNIYGSATTMYFSSYTCLGCRLTSELSREQDHYKYKKHKIMRAWLYDGDDEGWNNNDLPQALEDFGNRNIVQRALDLDDVRFASMNRTNPNNSIDKEFGEIQREFTWQELNHKHGMRNRSPLVSGKDKQWDNWDSSREDRRFAHGR